MRQKFKTPLLFSSIAIVVAAMAIGVTTAVTNRNRLFNYAAAGEHSITLDGSNAPTELTSSYQDTVQTTVKTEKNNPVILNFAMAKASEGNYVQLANNGYMHNFDSDEGRIQGISAITATLAAGSLKLSTTNYELSDGGVFLGTPVALSSGVRYSLGSPARYFQLKAGDSGATITSLVIEYTCDGDATPLPSTNIYNVEDFESYTATGTGWDTGNYNKYGTTNLRSAFYAKYYGVTSDPTVESSNWQLMGGNLDYVIYHATAGRNDSKTALLKVNNGNNFRYIQSKSLFGINSVIGKGSYLSVWIHSGYTDTSGTPTTQNVPVRLMAFYGDTFATGTNEAAVADYVIEAGSDWLEYVVELDPTRNVYAFGVYLAKIGSGTTYVPFDDITIYTESPYPAVHPTSVEIQNGLGKAMLTSSTVNLTAKVSPSNAANRNVTWSSSNTSVATVSSSGVVTAVAEGEATITATTVDGGLTDTFEVAVRSQLDAFGKTFYTQLNANINLIVACGAQGQCDIIISNTSMLVAWATYNNSTKQFSALTLGAYKGYELGLVTGTYDEGNSRLTGVNCSGNASALVSSLTINEMGSGSDSELHSCNLTVAQMRSTFKRTYLQYNTTEWKENTGDHDRFAVNSTNYVTGTNSMRVTGWTGGNVGLSLQAELSNTTYKSIGFWVYNPSSDDVKMSLFVYKATNFGGSVNPNSELYAKAGQWTYVCSGIGLKNYFDVGTDTLYNFKIVMGYKDVNLSYDEISLYV